MIKKEIIEDDISRIYHSFYGEKHNVCINAINFNKVTTIPGKLQLRKGVEIAFEFEEGVIRNFSEWSIKLKDIINCRLLEECTVELLLENPVNVEHIDANAQKLNSINYIVHIYSNEAKYIVKEIKNELAKETNNNKRRKQEIHYENIYYNNIKKNYQTFLITSKFGRNVPKKVVYNGFLYFNNDYNNLNILFDSESEIKNLELFCSNKYTEISIAYDNICDYSRKGNNLKIVVENDKHNIEKELLKYFATPIDDWKIYEINIKSEKALEIYNLLQKKIPLNHGIEEETFYCDNCGATVSDDSKKCPNCGAYFIEEDAKRENETSTKSNEMSGLLLILYIIFYPIIFIVSLPFMLLKNFTDLFKEDTRNEKEKNWDDWYNTRS